MPMIVAEQLTEEWWAAHLNRITGSSAGGCLGVVEKFSPVTAWKQIKQMKDSVDNWYTRYGTRMESVARASYERNTGHLVYTTGFWVHPQFDWLGASPDGIGEGGVEIKCPQNLPTEVPPKHLVQCAVTMAVVDLPYCDYYAWTPTDQFYTRIYRNYLYEAWMLVNLQQFYQDYILTDTPPPRRKPKKKLKEVSL